MPISPCPGHLKELSLLPICPKIALLLTATLMAAVCIKPAAAETSARLRIRHGSELTSAHVGPSAGGLAPRTVHPGGEIRDGGRPPFARRIDNPSAYEGISVDGPHLLIERTTFTGPVDVYTMLPVVFLGVDFRLASGAPWALHTRPGAGPILVLWSRAGAASVQGAPDDRSNAVGRGLYLRSEQVTVFRSHIESAADGIQIHAAGARIIETLIDGLVPWTGDHNDGIQMLGQGRSVEIVRSRIVNPNPQTSALNLIGQDVRVEASYLSGGGWTMYAGMHHPPRKVGMTKGVVVVDNVFGRDLFAKSGNFGAVTGWDSAGEGNRWSGNRYSDGTPLELPSPGATPR